jgi:dihydroxy-acid dehydratase
VRSPLRSRRWFAGDDEVALANRAAVRSLGIELKTDEDRPVIGIANSASDLNPCNHGLTALAEAVKRGIWAAGGIPLEFPTISLGEELMKPSAMLYRNLMAMDVEECLRAHPLDGVVLLGNCDKTIPAQLMAAASADLPAIQVSGGTRRPGVFRGRRLAGPTDLWRFWEQRRAGELDDETWAAAEACLGCSLGACNSMGTAATMSLLTEALGMMLPGTGAITAEDPRRVEAAEASGRRIVELVAADVRPSSILTPAAFDNAIAVLAAIGGSTNAVIHLCAIAGRRGIELPLARFAEIGRRVPMIVDVEPSGHALIDAFDAAGALPAVQAEIAEHLDLGVRTVGTAPLADVLAGAAGRTADGVIRPRADALFASGGIAVARGSLAPDGAIMKVSAASPALLRLRGRAVVFRGYEDLQARIDDPDLDVTPESVLVIAGCGPIGVPGMPEWGMAPIPRKLARQGVTDMARVTDGRMSGTSFGTVLLHAAPEAAAGGPIGLVRDGDVIDWDIPAGRADVLVSDGELAARRAEAKPYRSPHLRGWPRLYQEHVMQAPDGCDLDFLRAPTPAHLRFVEPVVGRS